MLPRAIPTFLLALVLALVALLVRDDFARTLSSSGPPALVSTDEHRSDQAPQQAEAEPGADMPDLLLTATAAMAVVAMLRELRQGDFDERAPPYLKGLLRPPRADYLSA